MAELEGTGNLPNCQRAGTAAVVDFVCRTHGHSFPTTFLEITCSFRLCQNPLSSVLTISKNLGPEHPGEAGARPQEGQVPRMGACPSELSPAFPWSFHHICTCSCNSQIQRKFVDHNLLFPGESRGRGGGSSEVHLGKSRGAFAGQRGLASGRWVETTLPASSPGSTARQQHFPWQASSGATETPATSENMHIAEPSSSCTTG